MASMTRKIQRNMVRTRCYKEAGNIKGFKREWDKAHYIIKDGKIRTKNGHLIKSSRKRNFLNRLMERIIHTKKKMA